MTETFDALIEASGKGGAYVTVPFDVERRFGGKRVRVRATFDGEPYRGSLVRMGGPDHILIVRKDIREKIGKQAGDPVRVTLEADAEPRTVEVPDDLRRALEASPAAEAFFRALSYTGRKEYVGWIEESRREETRRGRVRRAVALLLQGRKLR